MGRGQQLRITSEKSVMNGPDLRSMARQRRLVCVAFFAALLPFAITRSYLYYINPEVPSENTRFFQGKPTSAALHDNPLKEDVSNSSVPTSGLYSSNNGTHTINDQMHPDSDNARTISSSSSDTRSSSPSSENNIICRDGVESRLNGEEMREPDISGKHDISSNTSVSSTLSDSKMGTEKNVSSADYPEKIAERSSLSVNVSKDFSKAPLTESFENNSKGARNSKPLENEKNDVIVMDGHPTSTTKHTSHLRSNRSCDLVRGKWVPDPSPPQYTNSTCWYIQELQNCLKFGRQDVGFLYWKWKPDKCELPRIDAKRLLTAMRNRSIVFVGDSIARNQFQSLMCLLSQVEYPRNTYHTEDDKNNAYLFQTFNFTLAIYWSPYLVQVEDKPVKWPDNNTLPVAHIHLDKLDENWVKNAVGADILQVSTGQWWYKRALFFEKGEALGCHICDGWQDGQKELEFDKAYSKALANILKGSLLTPGFNGTVVLRSFAPDHFEDGEWHSGGKCPRTTPGGVPMRPITQWMHDIQKIQMKNITEMFNALAKDRLKLLDITQLAQIRADGHPSSYRQQPPNGPIQHDCLHWCLPGPIDTWNDLLVESLHDIIYR